MAMSFVSNIWFAFQIISSVQLNNEDSDDKKNKYRIKILKIIGKNILT